VGHLFDRRGLLTLAVLPVFTVPIPFLVFSGSYHLAIPGVVLWGAAMAVQETTMRAAIAELIPPARRGIAYGIFNTVYGAAWFAGSTAMGVLYQLGMPYAIAFALLVELASLPLIFLVARSAKALPGSAP
jgi:predicted MFS family arabinose efflux permease